MALALCQVNWSTSCRSSPECRDTKYMWGVWDSSQVPILTFEFLSVVSQWPHHLMSVFSAAALFASLSIAFFILAFPSVSTSFSQCIPSSSPASPFSAYLPWHTLFPSVPPFLPPPLSQVSDRPISAPMIAVGVLAWQLSRRWQEPGS